MGTSLHIEQKRMEELENEKRAVTKTIDADAAAKKKEAEDGKFKGAPPSRTVCDYFLTKRLFFSVRCSCRVR